MMKTLLTCIVCSIVLVSLVLFATVFSSSTNSVLASNFANLSTTKLPTLDTYITSGHETTGYGGEEWFWVGHDRANGNNMERSLLQFDLSEITTNSRIDSATVSLKLEIITPNDAPMTVNMYRIVGDWNNENISWREFENTYQVDRAVVATQVVGTEFIWYTWDVKPLVEAWLADPSHTSKFSVILESNQTSGQHERGFWSKNCSNSRCEKPKLEIQVTAPTPIPTSTLPPVATAMPTPVPVALALQYEVRRPTPTLAATAPTQIARVDVLPGDEIVYTIHYSVTSTVRNAQIKNMIPANVTPGAIQNGGTRTGNLITWNLSESSAGTTGTVSYEVAYNPSTTAIEIDIVTTPLTPTVAVGEQIIFTAKTPEDFTDIQRYQWAFGDGETDEGRLRLNTSHRYTKASNYPVTLTIETSACYVAHTIVVTITDNDTLIDNTIALPTQSVFSASSVANHLPVQQRLAELPPCGGIEPIINNGATVTWQGQSTPVSSNGLILNPGTILYMPEVRR